MERLFVLIGETKAPDNRTLLASWEKMPSQSAIDILTTKLSEKYERFAIMEDILFIPGGEKKPNPYSY